MDLALNNLQRLICHKTQLTKPNLVLSQLQLGRNPNLFYRIKLVVVVAVVASLKYASRATRNNIFVIPELYTQ